jgi:hypothetical protein
MSSPQHIGDFTFPCPFGQLEMATVPPPSKVSVSCTSSAPHSPHVIVPMLIPHFAQV